MQCMFKSNNRKKNLNKRVNNIIFEHVRRVLDASTCVVMFRLKSTLLTW